MSESPPPRSVGALHQEAAAILPFLCAQTPTCTCPTSSSAPPSRPSTSTSQTPPRPRTLRCVAASPPVQSGLSNQSVRPAGPGGGGRRRQRHPQRRRRRHRLQRPGPAAEGHAEPAGPGRHPLHPLQRQVRERGRGGGGGCCLSAINRLLAAGGWTGTPVCTAKAPQ